MVNLRVSVYLDSYFQASHMVYRGDNLSEAALSKHFYYLEAVKNLIFGLQNVISFLIVFICDSCLLANSSWDIICIIDHAIC